VEKAPDFFIWIRRNPLKSPDSAKEMQGNARIFSWFSLDFLAPNSPLSCTASPVPRAALRRGLAEPDARIASRRLTLIVKHQNLSMPLMRVSLPLRKPRFSAVGLTAQGSKRR
jgi:hypothetical protein